VPELLEVDDGPRRGVVERDDDRVRTLGGKLAAGSVERVDGLETDRRPRSERCAGHASVELDEECVNDIASQLSDEDAEAIVAAGPDGEADISDEGTAIGGQLMSCADQDEIIDVVIQPLQSSGQEFDEACVREGLEGVDMASLAAGDDSGMSEELIGAVVECFEFGS